jgi:Big-like domain-containing protein
VDRAFRLDRAGNQLGAPLVTKGTEPEGATFDGDFLWIADSGQDSLQRIDVGLACVPLNPFSADLFFSPSCGLKTLQLATNHQACTGSIELESSNPGVATVDANELVTAVSGGETQIVATCSTNPDCSTFVAIRVFAGACPTPTPTRTQTPKPMPTRRPGTQLVPSSGTGLAGAIPLILALAALAARLGRRRRRGAAWG